MNGRTEQAATSTSEWLAHIEAAQREGMTLAAYARVHGFSEKRLYRAKQRLRRVSEGPTKHPLIEDTGIWSAQQSTPFAQVHVAPLPQVVPPSRLLAQLPNGATVELECTAGDVSLVSALIETLGRCHVPVRR